MPHDASSATAPPTNTPARRAREDAALGIVRELFALRAERRLFGEVLDQLQPALLVAEVPNLRVLLCNRTCRDLFASSGETGPLEGSRLTAHFSGEGPEVLEALILGVIENRAIEFRTGFSIGGRGREPRPVTVRVIPLVGDERAAPDCLLITFADEGEPERSGKTAAPAGEGEFAGGVAHDFSNLLTVILGNITVALGQLPPEHPAVPGLRDSETAALRAADLSRQLRGFDRRSWFQPRSLDLNETVEEVLRLLVPLLGPDITLDRQLATDLWIARADPSRISQLLINLCMNACHAMPGGGRLTLETRNVPRQPALDGQTALGAYGDLVELAVRDTGRGMTREVLARIYDPYFTTRAAEGGTGMGLALVRGIVQQHGGWIECETEPGRGTCFTLRLPRLVPRPASPAGGRA